VGSKSYKSIDCLAWHNIPPFAVLTGVNGSGKTQLLELLAYAITKAEHPQRINIDQTKVTISGDSFGPDDVAYLPFSGAFSGVGPMGIARLQQTKQQLWQELVQNKQQRKDIKTVVRRARFSKNFGQDLYSLSQADFSNRLPNDFTLMIEDTDVMAGLAHVFLAYRLQYAQELEDDTQRELIVSKLGPAPWDVVNEVLQTADFSYRVISPLKSKLLDNYELSLEDRQTHELRNPNDLSSGEKVLLELVLWLYNSKHHNRFPRLFLLDEPDAHLHPSMTLQFMDVIKEVLVERYKVRVILTTHSPSTVALAPEESIFEMYRDKPRIRRSKSKADTIGLLTAGLVIVSPSSRYVLVEDQRDADFYGALILLRQ
jgi:predicted ATPase